MMGFPPLEAREDTLRVLGRVDLFGTGINPQQMESMRKLEVRREQLDVFAFHVVHAAHHSRTVAEPSIRGCPRIAFTARRSTRRFLTPLDSDGGIDDRSPS